MDSLILYVALQMHFGLLAAGFVLAAGFAAGAASRTGAGAGAAFFFKKPMLISLLVGW